MLRRLSLRNLALIEELELELGEGLTVITGETGAGKSILVDALALVAGGRASAELLRNGAERLVVAGEFDGDPAVRSLLAETGLPSSGTLLVRREVSPDGRSRAFVDDEPAAVRTLARVGSLLVSIYGQSSEQELVDAGAPLELLDAFARAEAERGATAAAAVRWADANERLEALEASRRERGHRLEMLDFQIREIEAVAPVVGEEEDLAADRERLKHADRIRAAAESALAALSEGEASASDRLGEASRAFAELAGIDPRETSHREEAEELKRRVADLAAAARDSASSIEADPSRLTAIETRLADLGRLQRKYGGSAAEVLDRLAGFRKELAELTNFEDALAERRRQEASARQAWREAATALSEKRRAASGKFSAAVEGELRQLAMEKARFRVTLEASDGSTPRAAGLEAVVFLFAPNPGEPEKPVERIASGGELSRLQLAIRSLHTGRRKGGRTLVFDEVDSGIGGRVAEVIGRKLRQIASPDQVLCVTHVPQIAALADRHFLAEKREKGGRTVATIRCLEGKERVAEIARMLAGAKVPETALQHARRLLADAGKPA